jgi:pyruvate dehydrogenase E1 component alpha subunit
VLFCQNNGWAISTPRAQQTAAETIAQKAGAYGFPGVQVDGNDPVAVYETVRDAVALARSGDGPTLVEALTYRLGAHTTADDASRYVPQDELRRRQEGDPIPRYAKWLEERGLWDNARAEAMDREIEEEIARYSAEADAEPRPPEDGFFDNVFAAPMPRQREQRRAFRESRGRNDG